MRTDMMEATHLAAILPSVDFINAGYLVGLSAIAIPVIIHLINRRRYRRVPWGAMRFLEEIIARRTQRRRLAEIILLLVRIGLLAFLALAIARPLVEGGIARLLPGAVDEDVVVIIDGSDSMSGEPWNRARVGARQAIERIRPNSSVSVYLATETMTPLIPAMGYDLAAAKESLEEIEVPGGGFDAVKALDTALATLEEGRNPIRRVVIFTDGQRFGWSGPDLWDYLGSEVDALPEKPEIHVVDVLGGEEVRPNIAVGDLTLSREVVGTDREVEIRATVVNFGPDEVPGLQAECRVGGETVGVEAVPPVGAGKQARVAWPYRFGRSGSHLVEVYIGGSGTGVTLPKPEDVIPGDNHRELAVWILESFPALLVNGAPSLEPLRGETDFLRAALAPRPGGAEEQRHLVSPKVIEPESLPAETLDPYEVVVLANVQQIPEDVVERIDRFVSGGRGLLVFPGDGIDRSFYNEHLFAGGKGWLPAAIGEPKGEVGSESGGFTLRGPRGEGAWSIIADPRDLDVASVRFSRYYSLLPGGDPDVSPLFAFDNGDPFLIEKRHGRGTVVLGATPMDADWSNLPARHLYVVLAHELIYHASRGRSLEGNIRAGQPIVHRFAGETNHALLAAPGTEERAVEVRSIGGQDGISVEDTWIPGVYTVRRPGEDPVHYAVGRPQGEADLTSLGEKDRNGISKATGARFHASAGDYLSASRGGGGQRDLWLYLLLATIAMLLLEGFLTRQIARSRAAADTQVPGFGGVSVPVGTPGSSRQGGAVLLACLPVAAFAALSVLFIVGLIAAPVVAAPSGTPPPDTSTSSTGLQFATEHRTLVIVGGAAILLIALLLYGRERRLVSRRTGAALLFLRALLAVILALALLHPVYTRTTRRHRTPDLVMLRDASVSMSIPDRDLSDARVLRLAQAMDLLPRGVARCGLDQQVRFLEEVEDWLAGGADPIQGRPKQWRSRFAEVGAYLRGLRGLPDILAFRVVSLQDAWEECRRGVERLLPGGEATGRTPLEILLMMRRRTAGVRRDALALADAIDRETYDAHRDAMEPIALSLRSLTRAEILGRVLDGAPGRRAIEERFRVSEYEFASEVAPRGGQAKSVDESPQAPGDDSRPSVGSRAHTDLAGPMMDITREAGAEAGVVVLSDGNVNAGDDPIEAARVLGERRIPVITVAIGTDRKPRDVGVIGIDANPAVFLKEKIVATVDLKADGVRGEHIQVAVLDGDDEVAREEFVAGEDAIRRRLTFRIPADELGPKSFRVVVTQPDGDVVPQNGEGQFSVRIVSEKTRILLVDGPPRWEYRFLRNLLLREEGTELEFVLAQALAGASLPQDRVSRGLPREEKEFNAYECIIIGDVPPSFFGPEGVKHLRSYVQDRGGTLIIIAGRDYMPETYMDTPLGDLLPARRSDGPGRPGMSPPPWASEGVRVVPTGSAAGSGEAFIPLQLVRDPAENRMLWQGFPAVVWGSPYRAARPGSEVLACYIWLGAGSIDPRERAAMISSHFGLGRVFFVGIDSTWRWRYKVGDVYHHRFWGQLIRWATADRLSSGNRFVRIGTDKNLFDYGEAVALRVRLSDRQGLPVNDAIVSAVVAEVDPEGPRAAAEAEGAGPPGGSEATGPSAGRDEHRVRVKLRPAPEGGGFYGATLGKLKAGRYRVGVAVPGMEKETEGVSHTFRVRENYAVEYTDLAADVPLLRRVAAESGGVFLWPEDLLGALAEGREELWSRVETFSYRLWDSPLLLIAFVIIVTIEWIVRKLAGLV